MNLGEENKNEIFEENQQNPIQSSNTKNKNNNKDIIRLKNTIAIDKELTDSAEVENAKEEIINVDLHLDEETNELINIPDNSINEKNELSSNESQEGTEDPRRKRRRSSASS